MAPLLSSRLHCELAVAQVLDAATPEMLVGADCSSAPGGVASRLADRWPAWAARDNCPPSRKAVRVTDAAPVYVTAPVYADPVIASPVCTAASDLPAGLPTIYQPVTATAEVSQE